jgi:hypothetical protein
MRIRQFIKIAQSTGADPATATTSPGRVTFTQPAQIRAQKPEYVTVPRGAASRLPDYLTTGEFKGMRPRSRHTRFQSLRGSAYTSPAGQVRDTIEARALAGHEEDGPAQDDAPEAVDGWCSLVGEESNAGFRDGRDAGRKRFHVHV